MKVVVVELVFQRRQLRDRNPPRLRRVVAPGDLRPQPLPQVEMEGVRDHATALAAVRMVEDAHRLQRVFHLLRQQLEAGLLLQLAHR